MCICARWGERASNPSERAEVLSVCVCVCGVFGLRCLCQTIKFVYSAKFNFKLAIVRIASSAIAVDSSIPSQCLSQLRLSSSIVFAVLTFLPSFLLRSIFIRSMLSLLHLSLCLVYLCSIFVLPFYLCPVWTVKLIDKLDTFGRWCFQIIRQTLNYNKHCCVLLLTVGTTCGRRLCSQWSNDRLLPLFPHLHQHHLLLHLPVFMSLLLLLFMHSIILPNIPRVYHTSVVPVVCAPNKLSTGQKATKHKTDNEISEHKSKHNH